MIRRFKSQQTFKKYQPHQSKWRRFLNWRKKNRINKEKFLYKKDENNKYKDNPFKKEKSKKDSDYYLK